MFVFFFPFFSSFDDIDDKTRVNHEAGEEALLLLLAN